MGTSSASTGFRLFGITHLLILVGVPAIAMLLSRVGRRSLGRLKSVRIALGIFVAVNELAFYVSSLLRAGAGWRYDLPLQLCDLAVWLTVISALTLNPPVCDVAWYTGIAGSGMALLTPDLWAPIASWPTISFFLSHGFTVITLLVLVWTGAARPRTGSVWRAWIVLNLFAAATGAINAALGTNYMYLRQKPASASLLDWFGPWPLYLIPAEAVALGLYWLLYLPFRPRSKKRLD